MAKKPSEIVRAATAVVLSMPAKRNKWSTSAYIPYKTLDKLVTALRADGWNIDALREANEATKKAKKEARNG